MEIRRARHSPTSLATSFGDLLRRHRLTAGLTQGQLAGRAGLSLCEIIALELGHRQAPRKHTIALLVDALLAIVGALTQFAAGSSVRLARTTGARWPLVLAALLAVGFVALAVVTLLWVPRDRL